MNELAGIYTNIKDYQSALKYAQKALQINETDEIESLGQNFLGLGEIYYYLAIPDSAFTILTKRCILQVSIQFVQLIKVYIM